MLLTVAFTATILSSCTPYNNTSNNQTANTSAANPSKAQTTQPAKENYSVTNATDTYRDFTIDNILHSDNNGDIHFNLYIPKSYDGSEAYALFVTLPGYEGLYFQGVGINLHEENFEFEAQKYNSNMIIVAPQLNGWDEESADETISLVEYLLSAYNIDKSKVYIEGYSGGGETASIAVSKRPDLFTAYLQVSSQWDGEYDSVAKAHLPVYIAIGRNDEYYGSGKSQSAYNTLYNLYKQQGLTESEIDKILVIDIKENISQAEMSIANTAAVVYLRRIKI